VRHATIDRSDEFTNASMRRVDGRAAISFAAVVARVLVSLRPMTMTVAGAASRALFRIAQLNAGRAPLRVRYFGSPTTGVV
jgi:hypothetical protein